MFDMKHFVVFCALICLCATNLYQNCLLLKITVRNNEEFEDLKKIEGLHVWNDAPTHNGTVLAHVDSEQRNSTLKALNDKHISYEIIEINLQDIIDKEKAETRKKQIRVPGGALNFQTYNTLADIYDYINSLPQRYPNKATTFSIGRTYENREIKAFIIRQNIQERKPIVFFECGIHAREWISPATCLWIANELLTKSNPLLNRFEFHIIPIVNPDGYQFTWTVNRLWRKNRSPNGARNCEGTDLNRNFDVDFCRVGCSRNPCDEIYCGRSPFSELESQALRDYFLSVKDSVRIYLDFHSFAQVWMYPYAYTQSNYPPNVNDLDRLSKVGVSALSSVYGTQYKVGTIAQLMSPTSSSSLDWIYFNLPSKLAFAIELRDTGRYGFVLPPNQIVPTAYETFTGVTAVLNRI